ncbi:hypothetical protein EJ08DRAFT_714927, partial [Tothia fuscella]
YLLCCRSDIWVASPARNLPTLATFISTIGLPMGTVIVQNHGIIAHVIKRVIDVSFGVDDRRESVVFVGFSLLLVQGIRAHAFWWWYRRFSQLYTMTFLSLHMIWVFVVSRFVAFNV